MAFDAGAVIGRMELALNEWKASVETVKKDQGDMGKAADEHSGALKGLWLQFAAGITIVTLANKAASFIKDTIKDSVREAAAYEKALSTLDATFMASGRNMPGMTQRLKDYAHELQALGLADDVAILKSETLLLRMTNLNEKGIKEATRLAAGLAYVYEIDLDSATTLIGKGMEGVYRGFISLCPAIMNATTETGKHKAMMKFLNDTYVAAQAQMKTYAGEVKALGLEWDDAKKGFGEAILNTGILQRGLEEITDILREFTEATRSHKGEAEKEIEVQNKRFKALQEVAKGMGMSKVALINLIMAHDGYSEGVNQGNLATYQWIQSGNEGKKAQELLAVAVENQNKKLTEQKKRFNETGTATEDFTQKTKSLAETLNLTFTVDLKTRLDNISRALKLYKDELPESEVRRLMAEQQKLNDELTTGGLVLGMVKQRLEALEKPLGTIALGFTNVGKDGARAIGKLADMLPDIPKAAEKAAKETESVWKECSTVISDSLKEIAKSIVDSFGLVEALAYKPIDYEKTGMADYFKKVYKDLNKDYENRKHFLDLENEAAKHSLDRQYDDSKTALDKKYEDDKDYIKKTITDKDLQDAALKKLEEEHLKAEKELEEKHYQDEQALEEKNYQDLKLLAEWFAGEQDRIRKDEDKARDKHAQDELDRQNSLWENVKKIFGTACENMATIFLTKMFEPVGDLAAKLAKKLIGKGTDSVADALDGVGGKTENLGKVIGEFISGVGEGIGGFISGLASGIATAIVEIATAIASAATILAAAAGPLAIVLAIAAAAYLTFGLISAFLASIGKGSKDTDVTYWLKKTHDLTQEIHDCLLIDYKDKYFNDFYNFLYSIERHTSDTIDAVNGVKEAIKDLPSLQTGGYVPETGPAMLHAGEYVIPSGANQGFINAAPSMMGSGPNVNNYITFNIEAIDGPSVERLVKGPVSDILDDVYRQNKKGLTTNLNKYLKEMA